MANKPPAFQFYASDFLADDNVDAMTLEEQGAYVRLLCHAWRSNTPGSLPNDDHYLSSISRLGLRKWKRSRTKILRAFKISNGVIVQKRMTEEYSKLLQYRETQKENSNKRWKRDSDGNAMGYPKVLPSGSHKHPLQSSSSSSIFPSGSEEPTEPKKIIKKTHPRLEAFLEEYRKKFGRDYIVTNYGKEGGEAKATESKIKDDEQYRQAVRVYLSATDKRIVEASHPFGWFINDLNRWASQAQAPPNSWSYLPDLAEEMRKQKEEIERQEEEWRQKQANSQPKTSKAI